MYEVTATLKRCVAICDRLRIDYAVMGGFAVRVYGVPRPTYDVDLTLMIERERLPALYDEIEREGYTVPEEYRTGWIDNVGGMPFVRFRLYVESNAIDVDLFLAETAFQRELIHRRQRETLDDHDIWIVTAEDLILLKLIANRPRDLLDIQDVRFMHGELDEDHLRTWADRLQIRDRLDAVLSKPAL